MGSRYYKSLILTGEDFFLFCDPPVTPAFAFLFPGAAAGATGFDVVATGGDLVSAAPRLAAGGNPGPGTGSPARLSPGAAALAAAAVGPLEILLIITLGPIPGFITQHSLEAATGPLARSGRSLLATVGSAADTAAAAALGSTTAGFSASTPAADSSAAASSKASPDSASLTSLNAVAASAAGATAAASTAGTDSSTLDGPAATTCSMAGTEGCTVAGSTTKPAVGGPTAAGLAVAAESSAGTGGALPLHLHPCLMIQAWPAAPLPSHPLQGSFHPGWSPPGWPPAAAWTLPSSFLPCHWAAPCLSCQGEEPSPLLDSRTESAAQQAGYL